MCCNVIICLSLFVDDTYLKYSSSSEKNMRKNTNKDLDDLFEWLCANRLSLNVSKTEFIIFKPPKKYFSDLIILALNGKTLFESKKLNILALSSMIGYPGSFIFMNFQKNWAVLLEFRVKCERYATKIHSNKFIMHFFSLS